MEQIEEIKNSQAPEAEDPEKFEIAKKKEIRKVTRRCIFRTTRNCVKPAAIGFISLAAYFKSFDMMRHTCSILGIGYATLDRRMKFLEKNIVDTYGEEEANRLFHGYEKKEVEILEEDDNGNPIVVKKQVNFMGENSNPYSFMFTKGTSTEWKPNCNYNEKFVEGILAYWDTKLKSGTYDKPEVILLNDVLEDLGMKRTAEGAVTGWVTGRGDGYINGRLVNVYKEAVHNGANPRDLVPSVAMNFNCMVNVHKYIR